MTIVIALFATSLFAQDISFKRLGLEEGLSESAGLSIVQDHLNRIWIGTRNGLNCWDGIRMKTFYPSRGDTASLMEHKTVDLKYADNYLWIRSISGVSRLDLSTMAFQRFYLDGLNCLGIYNDKILAGTSKGLLLFNKERPGFEPASELLGDNLEISDIYQDSSGNLWLVSNSGQQLFLIQGNGDRKVIEIPVDDNLIVFDMFMDSRGDLWIGTRYHGIFVYSLQDNSFKNINKNTQPYFTEDLSVRCITEDKRGRLWVGTFKGLAIFDLNNETTSFIHSSENDKFSLSHNSVYSLHISNDDNIWVGTYFGGVNYGRVANQVFKKYHEMASGERPSYPVIGQLIEDSDQNIWIATEGGGIDYFDRKKKRFINFPATGDPGGLSQTNVKSLFIDDNKLLVGTYQGGLNIMDLNTRIFTHYNNPTRKTYPNHVNSILKFKEGYLLGTEMGVLFFNPESQEFIPFFKAEDIQGINETVNVLYIDSKGSLWVGYENHGLVSYNIFSKKFHHYVTNEFDSLTVPYNSINYIMEDHRFKLWIGTDGGGFCLFNREDDNFISYNRQINNIPSDFVYGIEESRFGNLWIATSKGLSRFDVENNQFFNYTSESGFPLNELNYKSLLLTEDGELFIGGIDGLVSFREKELLQSDQNLYVNLSTLRVNNKEISANDSEGILVKDISVTESFVLKPKHTVFSIDFSSFNYNNTLNNKYQYQLDGFDADWVNAEFNTTATYTNLNPGTYRFKVRATDVAYNPITEINSVKIRITPPFSRTWLAYSIYVIIVIGLILLFNNFYLGKMRLQYQLRNERAEIDRIKELNFQKLRFFTNISHEFMSPLTIILSSLENAFSRHKIPARLNWQLSLAFRNAKRLKNLNSELLDFRKIEQGHLKLRVQENNIIPWLHDIFDAFKVIAANKEIDYRFESSDDNVSLFYDASQMDKVFFNLLSNAMNHAPGKTGRVTIELIDREKDVEICVRDNGKGIPKEDAPRVFDRFFHQDSSYTDSSYQGSGIGLALSQSIVNAHKGSIRCESEENKGTNFVLTLKKGFEHFSEDEFSDKIRDNRFKIDKDLIHLSEEIAYNEESDYDETEFKDRDIPLLLVVEDNPEIRMVIKDLFREDYHIIGASDGVDGMDKAMKHQPDIIISDVLMPRLSGFNMCKKLKDNINTSHIPIILLTALDSEEDHTMALKQGADSYCTKPFNADMLKASVENLFRNRAILQEKYSTDLAASTKTITRNRVDRKFLHKSREVVEQNLLNPKFNVDEFAMAMNMGRTVFYSKVKTITGQTPNDYVQTIRLKIAADMLINDTEKNISEIAYETGFNSPRYFSIAFKKHFGVNPSRYVVESTPGDEGVAG